jgi:hypothetical protein
MSSITVSVGWLAALYGAFVVKQFLGDSLLQTTWMALGKAQQRDWLAPLVTHAGIHGTLTLLLMLALRPSLWWLGPLDFVVHGVIDYGKSSVTRSLDLTDKDAGWWWLFGLDQRLHEATHFAYLLAILVTA